MKKPIFLILTLLLGAVTSQAQFTLSPTVISSGGGHFESENISFSWTLGELAVSTLSGGNLVLTQGFQQPVIKEGVGIKDHLAQDWHISIYPNPFVDQVSIRFDTREDGDYMVEIQDVSGRLLYRQDLDRVRKDDLIQLGMSAYSPGMYFLRITSKDSQEVVISPLQKF